MTGDMDDSLQSRLLLENEEYKMLTEEHKDLGRKVTQLAEKKYLLPDEELELKRLKKSKMTGKERMYQIVEQAR